MELQVIVCLLIVFEGENIHFIYLYTVSVINCKIVLQGIAYLTTMGRNLLRRTKTMIMLVATVLFHLSPAGGLRIVLRVILTVGIKNLLSTHGKASFGTPSER